MKQKKIIIDSSSAILLYKSGLFDRLAETYEITITKSVYIELTQENYPGYDFFKNKYDEKSLSIANLENSINSENNKLSHLGIGERDSIQLFKDNNFDFIIIDDGKGAKYCRNNDIPYINALLVPKIFYLSGFISEGEYLKKKDEIISFGRYSKEIIEYVYECGMEELSIFLINTT